MPNASPNDVVGVVNWELPPEGCFKLNVHVAVDAIWGLFGLVGTEVHNHEGKVMVTGVHKWGYVNDVDFGEIEACFGLRLASKIGLSLLLIELDSLCTVKLVLGQASVCTKLFWLIADIQRLLMPKQDF